MLVKKEGGYARLSDSVIDLRELRVDGIERIDPVVLEHLRAQS